MKKSAEVLVVLAFLCAIFAVPVLSLRQVPKTYSIFENRSLAQKPRFSRQELWSGKYFKNWDTYLSDQVYGRNSMFTLFVKLQTKVLKKPVVNDTVVMGDILLPFLGYPTYDFGKQKAQVAHMADELSALNDKIQNYGGKFLYVGIPEQHSMLRDEYPWYMDNDAEKLNRGEKAFFSAMDTSGISYINMRKWFVENGFANAFSKIDHHFTYQGAYQTYLQIAKTLQITPAKFAFSEVPNPYYGSRNRKLYNQFHTNEKFQVGELIEPVSFTRVDNGEPVASEMFNIPQNAKEPVTYIAYMGGDIAETVISTDRPELPNILIFGDSFTNPLEGMLYVHANKMRSIDLRHYKDKTLYEYIDEYQPDIVICVRDDTNYWIAEGNGTFR